jgi:hypothetical protein
MSETAPSEHRVGSNPASQVALDLGAQASAGLEGRIRRPACLLRYGSAPTESLGDMPGSVHRAGRPSSEPTADGCEARASNGLQCVRWRYASALRSRLVLRAESDEGADWLSWM